MVIYSVDTYENGIILIILHRGNRVTLLQTKVPDTQERDKTVIILTVKEAIHIQEWGSHGITVHTTLYLR